VRAVADASSLDAGLGEAADFTRQAAAALA